MMHGWFCSLIFLVVWKIAWFQYNNLNFSTFEGIKEEDSSVPPLNGFNIWHTISEGAPSPRTEILHNIDVALSSVVDKSIFDDYEGIAIRVDDMKLLMRVPNLTWYKPPELSPEYQRLDQVQWSRLWS